MNHVYVVADLLQVRLICCLHEPDCPKGAKHKGSKGSSTNKRKRRASDALLPGAKLMRRKGGICLSDDEDEPSSHPGLC